MPFTVVQLTDPHIGAQWSTRAASTLGAVVAAVGELLGRAPDAVIVTGDVASTPTDGEYAEARAILDGLGAPLYPVPGNHDDGAGLLRHFATPSGTTSYAAGLGPVRLVALDTTRPDDAGGRLDPARLEWLEATLAEDASTPTLLAMHHPPLVTGIPTMDAIGIADGERRALADILARHPQVQVIACGPISPQASCGSCLTRRASRSTSCSTGASCRTSSRCRMPRATPDRLPGPGPHVHRLPSPGPGSTWVCPPG